MVNKIVQSIKDFKDLPRILAENQEAKEGFLRAVEKPAFHMNRENRYAN